MIAVLEKKGKKTHRGGPKVASGESGSSSATKAACGNRAARIRNTKQNITKAAGAKQNEQLRFWFEHKQQQHKIKMLQYQQKNT